MQMNSKSACSRQGQAVRGSSSLIFPRFSTLRRESNISFYYGFISSFDLFRSTSYVWVFRFVSSAQTGFIFNISNRLFRSHPQKAGNSPRLGLKIGKNGYLFAPPVLIILIILPNIGCFCTAPATLPLMAKVCKQRLAQPLTICWRCPTAL